MGPLQTEKPHWVWNPPSILTNDGSFLNQTFFTSLPITWTADENAIRAQKYLANLWNSRVWESRIAILDEKNSKRKRELENSSRLGPRVCEVLLYLFRGAASHLFTIIIWREFLIIMVLYNFDSYVVVCWNMVSYPLLKIQKCMYCSIRGVSWFLIILRSFDTHTVFWDIDNSDIFTNNNWHQIKMDKFFKSFNHIRTGGGGLVFCFLLFFSFH